MLCTRHLELVYSSGAVFLRYGVWIRWIPCCCILCLCSNHDNGGESLVAWPWMFLFFADVQMALPPDPERSSPDKSASLDATQRSPTTSSLISICGSSHDPKVNMSLLRNHGAQRFHAKTSRAKTTITETLRGADQFNQFPLSDSAINH
jgi:hypothetical protein